MLKEQNKQGYNTMLAILSIPCKYCIPTGNEDIALAL